MKVYSVTKRVGDYYYGDTVCASSWEEAEILAEILGGEVDGEIISELPASDEDLIYGFSLEVYGKRGYD